MNAVGAKLIKESKTPRKIAICSFYTYKLSNRNFWRYPVFMYDPVEVFI